MSNALLADVQARAERRRTQTRDGMWQELVQDAWNHSRAAAKAGDAAGERRWLERAHRMAPRDGMVAVALADALLRCGEAAEAANLFEKVAREHGLPEAWVGLAAAARLLGDTARAVGALTTAVRCTTPTPVLRHLADLIVRDAGAVGWCGLDTAGALHAGPGQPDAVRLDADPVRVSWVGQKGRLPPRWRASALLHAERGGAPLLGSPLPIGPLTQIEGFVEARNGGLSGWAWYPADPGRDPVLRVCAAGGDLTLTARDLGEGALLARPLAKPRRFAVPPSMLPPGAGVVSVLGADGRHLLGSPLDPGLERRVAMHGTGPVWANVIGPAPVAETTRPAADVVVPVYRGLLHTMDCLDSVLATVPRGTRVHVVEDASPEPDLVAALLALARRRRIRLIRMGENRGFPAAANAGLRACAGRDVVLLNSDTLVPPGWLERLREAAYSAPDIGTATPLSNDATILSYPDPDQANPIPDLAETIALDALAQSANGAGTVEVPTGVGFCLYMRRDCLDQTGLFREDLFAQGYGEENDFCLRARHRGWRHVAATGVFVAHVGGQSFGAARAHLIRRNLAVLNRWHPGYDALIEAHVTANPLHPARRRMDELRWAAGRRLKAAIFVTHAGGGGVDRVVEARASACLAEGWRAIVLRPAQGGCLVQAPGKGAFPNLRYAVPDALPALARLLRADRVQHMEVHHLLGHDHAVLGLARRLRVPVDTFLHDYASFCPRIALVTTTRRYCGEPDIAGCEACVADLDTLLEDPIGVADLVVRSAGDLGASRRVMTPSRDAAIRIGRRFPGVQPEVTPWEGMSLPPLAMVQPGPPFRVCVVGAIGVEKGFEVLLACARDAHARRLALEFVVVGYTMDDTRLMQAGPVFVTGEYRDAEAVALIRRQCAHLGFIPSMMPETWCFALSRAWESGLAVAAFDLGAQAERIRATGRGWLLPLGLTAGGINDALLAGALARSRPPLQCSPG